MKCKKISKKDINRLFTELNGESCESEKDL